MSQKFLTKSKFAASWQCPRKLFYLNHKEYGNNNSDDSFLKALAEGGFQVGALAKSYYPKGVEVEALDKDEAVRIKDLKNREPIQLEIRRKKTLNLNIPKEILWR